MSFLEIFCLVGFVTSIVAGIVNPTRKKLNRYDDRKKACKEEGHDPAIIVTVHYSYETMSPEDVCVIREASTVTDNRNGTYTYSDSSGRAVTIGM